MSLHTREDKDEDLSSVVFSFEQSRHVRFNRKKAWSSVQYQETASSSNRTSEDGRVMDAFILQDDSVPFEERASICYEDGSCPRLAFENKFGKRFLCTGSSANGRFVAAGLMNGDVLLWEVTTDRRLIIEGPPTLENKKLRQEENERRKSVLSPFKASPFKTRGNVSPGKICYEKVLMKLQTETSLHSNTYLSSLSSLTHFLFLSLSLSLLCFSLSLYLFSVFPSLSLLCFSLSLSLSLTMYLSPPHSPPPLSLCLFQPIGYRKISVSPSGDSLLLFSAKQPDLVWLWASTDPKATSVGDDIETQGSWYAIRDVVPYLDETLSHILHGAFTTHYFDNPLLGRGWKLTTVFLAGETRAPSAPHKSTCVVVSDSILYIPNTAREKISHTPSSASLDDNLEAPEPLVEEVRLENNEFAEYRVHKAEEFSTSAAFCLPISRGIFKSDHGDKGSFAMKPPAKAKRSLFGSKKGPTQGPGENLDILQIQWDNEGLLLAIVLNTTDVSHSKLFLLSTRSSAYTKTNHSMLSSSLLGPDSGAEVLICSEAFSSQSMSLEEVFAPFGHVYTDRTDVSKWVTAMTWVNFGKMSCFVCLANGSGEFCLVSRAGVCVKLLGRRPSRFMRPSSQILLQQTTNSDVRTPCLSWQALFPDGASSSSSSNDIKYSVSSHPYEASFVVADGFSLVEFSIDVRGISEVLHNCLQVYTLTSRSNRLLLQMWSLLNRMTEESWNDDVASVSSQFLMESKTAISKVSLLLFIYIHHFSLFSVVQLFSFASHYALFATSKLTPPSYVCTPFLSPSISPSHTLSLSFSIVSNNDSALQTMPSPCSTTSAAC